MATNIHGNPFRSPERLAYWYFRLNGFFTIENFLVHHETRSDIRTDADLLATRFHYRRENEVWPMEDEPQIAKCLQFANIIIAEIKTGDCALNGPWTNRTEGNMQRILNSIGCCSQEEIEDAAERLYNNGHWFNQNASVRLFAIGERKDQNLSIDESQQLEWTHIINFCIERFRSYRPQKSSNGQWSQDGKLLRNLALRGEGDVAAIRNHFLLNPAERR